MSPLNELASLVVEPVLASALTNSMANTNPITRETQQHVNNGDSSLFCHRSFSCKSFVSIICCKA